MILPEQLGCPIYKERHNLKYAYASGGMYQGIASKELVTAMANQGFMPYFGAGGLSLTKIEEALLFFKQNIKGTNYGVNILFNHITSASENSIIDLLLKHDIKNIELAAFYMVTPEIVKFRLKGLTQLANGKIISRNNIMAKVSRLEIAKTFMNPSPPEIIDYLLANGDISPLEAKLGKVIPVANSICVEAESAGHTDRRAANVIFPTIIRLRDRHFSNSEEKISIGLAGGISTPEAAAAAFMMGADFILTGSINQCTIESGAHSVVKELLSKMGIEDTDFTPTGDMLETDAKIQVLKKGTLFPLRAKKLHELYHRYNSIDELNHEERSFVLDKVFEGKTFEQIFEEAKICFSPTLIEEAQYNPKAKMGLIFKVYFYKSIKHAYSGNLDEKINFQIHTGVAMGAFNNYVLGSDLEHHSKRSAPLIGLKLMQDTANQINKFYKKFSASRFENSTSEIAKV